MAVIMTGHSLLCMLQTGQKSDHKRSSKKSKLEKERWTGQ